MFNWLGKKLGLYRKETDLFCWFGQKLGINELRKRLDDLEDRVTHLENSTDLILNRFGKYKSRNSEELKLMELQISDLLSVINSVLSTLDNEEGIRRTKKLLKKVKNNKTRIMKAMVV
jgi:archaellum component FlaC